jgi:hypothetical protein
VTDGGNRRRIRGGDKPAESSRHKTGECIFCDDSSIFDAPGSQWGVRHDDNSRDLNFTLWRLKKGGDGVTLFVTTGGKTHRVNTLPVGPPANRRGSGAATFEKRGVGGAFTIDAVADTGAKITGQLTCSAFARPEDNGR